MFGKNPEKLQKIGKITLNGSEFNFTKSLDTIPNLLNYVSKDRLSSFFFNEEVILKIINAFNINKAHGYHDISIWMIKLCSKSVVKPLSMIFNNCMDSFQLIMDFLEENYLLNSNQSGFRPNDSCKSQLLSVVHDIYSSFDCHPSPEVRGLFLDISKAFDRVWHKR